MRLWPLESVVFVCGCGHSGTTLMANMLAAHPDTYVPRWETAIFFRRPAGAIVRYNELKWRARLAGKRHLVEKTPRHIHKLSIIRRVAPRSRFIVSVRDGRDVTASIAKRGMSIQDGIGRWIHDNAIVLDQRDRGDVVVYRHEDLITDPEGTLRRLCDAVKIPYSERLLNYHEEERLWFGVDEVTKAPPDKGHEDHRNWQVNQPIFDNRGRWKDELSPEDVEPLVNGPGRDLMRAFGYLD